MALFNFGKRLRSQKDGKPILKIITFQFTSFSRNCLTLLFQTETVWRCFAGHPVLQTFFSLSLDFYQMTVKTIRAWKKLF